MNNAKRSYGEENEVSPSRRAVLKIRIRSNQFCSLHQQSLSCPKEGFGRKTGVAVPNNHGAYIEGRWKNNVPINCVLVIQQLDGTTTETPVRNGKMVIKETKVTRP